jgi:hypothetical protein
MVGIMHLCQLHVSAAGQVMPSVLCVLQLTGINVVLAGSVAALEQHCQSIRDHPTLQGSDIDFKLSAEDSQQQQDQRATEETGFDHLTVRQCKVRHPG